MYLLLMYGMLLFVPLLASMLVRKRFRGFGGFLLSVVLSSFFMSSTVVAHWLAFDWYLAKKIEVLDRDGDGVWSSEEETTWTPEERRNLEAHIGDGGRNVFAAIIYPVFSVAYSVVAVGACWGFVAIRQRKKNA